MNHGIKLLFSKNLEHDIEDTTILLGLILQDNSLDTLEPRFDYYPEINNLLENFQDIPPDELPDQLPPMRSIQHAIDLVPGSQLPDCPHYRMNSADTVELNKQIQGLLAKNSFVSLSPCAVLVLLTHKKDLTWRMCVNSRATNKITIKDRFPFLGLKIC